jgi:SAM-dependent methyltransferase
MIFDNWINRLAGDALKILDIGGRYQPYRRLFGDRVARYIACDILSSDLVDVMASGECLPFAADTFDVVISTQVFEYFQNPAKAGAEVYRVLKPGGVLLMSVASLAPRFVDEECWRFNKGASAPHSHRFRQSR